MAPVSTGPSPLAEVFDIERESHALVEAEGTRAAAWLAGERLGAEQATGLDLARMMAAAAAFRADGARTAAAEAAAIVERAAALAAGVASLDTARLDAIVERHLATLAGEVTP